ncbi:zinc ABC transporter substrate-binding protein [Roseibium sp. AS2]|uniref:zinc ABC transporter substrate-binding protein n=1 Tax=Roseibium sp. AS2 TaxID=3135781 RepID=UPI00317F2AD2
MPFPQRQTLSSRKRLSLLSTCLGGALLAMTTAAAADSPSVVTTIKPLHSIASAVMDGVGEPLLLIDGAASPHGFALKPSQAFLLQGADAVFWVGEALAPSLAKPISSMADDAAVVEMMDVTGIQHLDIREGTDFDAHDHGDHHDEHAHDEHDHEEDDHAHGDHDDHEEHEEHADHDDHEEHADHDDHEEHADHDDHEEHADHDGHEGHDHAGAQDAHVWLNPDNGIVMATQMADTLARIDPDHADIYKKNAAAFADRIEALEGEIVSVLEPVSGKKFVVFHDAYHHFEHHFDMEASGAITLSPETLSSAERVAQVRARIRDLGVTCVFREPQFESKLVEVVIEGSEARVGTLDPLGTQLENGPDLYPELLKGLAVSLASCLNGDS